LQHEVVQIVVRVDEVGAHLGEVHVLQGRHENQCGEVQGIQTRQAQDEKHRARDFGAGDLLAIFPEENEPADAPEHFHAVEAILVEQAQEPIQGLLGRDEIDLGAADEFEVLIVKDENGDRAQESEQFDSEEFAVRLLARSQDGVLWASVAATIAAIWLEPGS
jgi:hypothetical protein